MEEQEYLTSLRREKEAFHLLINAKTVCFCISNESLHIYEL